MLSGSNSFVRAANLLQSLPSAAKPPWWSSVGLKQRCGLVLSNPQGLLPDSELVSPAWQLTGFAFEMDNLGLEAARCYDEAAGYELDRTKCMALMARATELRGGAEAESEHDTKGQGPDQKASGGNSTQDGTLV